MFIKNADCKVCQYADREVKALQNDVRQAAYNLSQEPMAYSGGEGWERLVRAKENLDCAIVLWNDHWLSHYPDGLGVQDDEQTLADFVNDKANWEV